MRIFCVVFACAAIATTAAALFIWLIFAKKSSAECKMKAMYKVFPKQYASTLFCGLFKHSVECCINVINFWNLKTARDQSLCFSLILFGGSRTVCCFGGASLHSRERIDFVCVCAATHKLPQSSKTTMNCWNLTFEVAWKMSSMSHWLHEPGKTQLIKRPVEMKSHSCVCVLAVWSSWRWKKCNINAVLSSKSHRTTNCILKIVIFLYITKNAVQFQCFCIVSHCEHPLKTRCTSSFSNLDAGFVMSRSFICDEYETKEWNNCKSEEEPHHHHRTNDECSYYKQTCGCGCIVISMFLFFTPSVFMQIFPHFIHACYM